MTTTTDASLLDDIDLRPDAPPVLRVTGGADAAAWAGRHRDAVRAAVGRHGALLVRGLGLTDPAQATAVFAALGSGLMTEREAFAARTAHGDGVYSSSAWPAAQPMCMHHELSYARRPPGTMFFACLQAPTEGGATTIADAADVLDALPADLVDRAEATGWMLVRRYNEDIGATVGDAFGTDDPAQIDAYCRANDIESVWEADGSLVTRQRRPAIVTHPVTGRRCWFNQVAFLSEWTLDPDVREFLLDCYGPEGLPFTTCFGDGEPIGPDVVALLADVYDAHTRREPWQSGDLLVVDNLATAHAREPYSGAREVLVAMTDEMSRPGEAPRGASGADESAPTPTGTTNETSGR